VVDGDVREPDAIIAAITGDIDLEASACLLMGYRLHFLRTRRRARPSSQLRRTTGAGELRGALRRPRPPCRDETGFRRLFGGRTQVCNHSVQEFASFFGPLKLVPPGVVDGREWFPDSEHPVHVAPHDGQVIVGVARV
jgi:hypothetical protein